MPPTERLHARVRIGVQIDNLSTPGVLTFPSSIRGPDSAGRPRQAGLHAVDAGLLDVPGVQKQII